jgi:hypothetical protein
MTAPESIQVRWRGEVVGTLSEVVPDMWYIEGVWNPAATPRASEFAAKAGLLDPKVVLGDPTKGFRIEVEDGGSLGGALVLSLADGRLFIRRVLEEIAIKWLRSTVSE